MTKRIVPAAFVLLAAASAPMNADPKAVHWKTLEEGIEYAVVEVQSAVPGGDRLLHVVRVDPAKAHLTALLASQHGKATRTARQWSDEFHLAVAINIGMYQEDHLSNVGYLRNGDHVNNGHWANNHKSAFGFSQGTSGGSSAIMIDLDAPGAMERLKAYETVVQNLRLIKAPGENVWQQQPKRWSEAALAWDSSGRLLFLFSRTPHSMWELNQLLLALPLGIVHAMHMEGGPEASLSVHAGGVDLDLSGSFETGFYPSDGNPGQWPIPNVLGVLKPPK